MQTFHLPNRKSCWYTKAETNSLLVFCYGKKILKNRMSDSYKIIVLNMHQQNNA